MAIKIYEHNYISLMKLIKKKKKGVSHQKKTISDTDADDACLCIDKQNLLWLEEANHISHTAAHAWYKSDLESNNSIESEETETTLLGQWQRETLQTPINTEPLMFDFEAVWLLEWRKMSEEKTKKKKMERERCGE